VADADLVVWIGPELTPWLDNAMDTRPEGASALALLTAEGTFTRAYSDPGHDAGHAEEGGDHAEEGHDHATEAEDHAEEEGHYHDHAHDGSDPHVWLDPGNGRTWLGLIATELSRLDPANAATYQANATAAAQRIDALDAEITAILTPIQGKPVVTFHDAYGYFGDHYGLTFAGSIALGDASSPGAQRLSELRATMEAGTVLCIFPEAQHDPALVTQMAEGTGAKVGGVLDPVGSTLEPGPDAYAALLKGMATTLADCLAE
jgi:zinc transport system substrate-binding protein